MENKNNTENEMFLMSKYKYINKLAKNVVQVASMNINKNIPNIVDKAAKNLISEEEKAKKKAEAELQNKLKEEKKKKMAEMCKPGVKNENKTKFIEKEKFVDETPKGEKKGIEKI